MGLSIGILLYILYGYNFFLIAVVLMSWFPALYNFRIFRLIGKVGNWYLEPFSGILVLGPIDFTPIVGFMLYDGLVTAILFLLGI